MRAVVLLAAGAVLLSGCVARTAWNVATLPVKAASKTVDVLTTSQDEADRNLGRKVRKEEERRGREARKERDDD
jgi:PBP1b-binding outer membrane lipoprotein LpoB